MSSPESKVIKIAFVGTSCTGKTDLLKHYQEQFEGDLKVAFVKEAARDLFDENPEIKDRFSAATQRRIQALALQREREAHASGATVIFCDRSTLDAVAYVWAEGDHEGALALYNQPRIQKWLPTYDYLFLLDPDDVPYEKMGARQEEEEERQRFHQGFLKFFERENIPYQLLSGTIEERAAQIDKVLHLDYR